MDTPALLDTSKMVAKAPPNENVYIIESPSSLVKEKSDRKKVTEYLGEYLGGGGSLKIDTGTR